jgi:hypothetical protein
MHYYDTLQLFRINHIDSYFDGIRGQSLILDVSQILRSNETLVQILFLRQQIFKRIFPPPPNDSWPAHVYNCRCMDQPGEQYRGGQG